jgi:hypothetical protein
VIVHFVDSGGMVVKEILIIMIFFTTLLFEKIAIFKMAVIDKLSIVK